MRDTTPRAAHGGWKPPKDRRDTIELLHESNESRIPATPERNIFFGLTDCDETLPGPWE